MVDQIVANAGELRPNDLDEHFVSLAMLHLLLADAPTFSRDELAAIIRVQFPDIEFTAWPDLNAFYAIVSPEFSEGFRALCIIAYLVLGTETSVDAIRTILKEQFDIHSARDLREFVEAEARFQSVAL